MPNLIKKSWKVSNQASEQKTVKPRKSFPFVKTVFPLPSEAVWRKQYAAAGNSGHSVFILLDETNILVDIEKGIYFPHSIN